MTTHCDICNEEVSDEQIVRMDPIEICEACNEESHAWEKEQGYLKVQV